MHVGQALPLDRLYNKNLLYDLCTLSIVNNGKKLSAGTPTTREPDVSVVQPGPPETSKGRAPGMQGRLSSPSLGGKDKTSCTAQYRSRENLACAIEKSNGLVGVNSVMHQLTSGFHP